MTVARVIRLEGVETPCLLLSEDGRLPEELVVDFPKGAIPSPHEGRQKVVFRLQPSSKDDPAPSYGEMFDD
ncbi:MAG: hypothetical protein U1F36_12435 [Planctomycetota bacterium]